MLEQRLARAAVAGCVGAREVDAAEAVHLQVDEARDRDPAAAAAVHADRRDPSVRDLDVAAQEHAVDDRRLDAEPHASAPSARRIEPPASPSRWRAASIGDPVSRERIATFASPSAADERRVGFRVGDVGRELDHAARACPQLRVAGDDVDHQVPERPAEPDHRDGRDRVQDELLRRPGLHPRRARDHLGPGDRDDLVVGQTAELGVAGAHDGDRQRAGFGRRARGAERVGRAAARRERDDRVGRADLSGGDVLGALQAVVLRRLLRHGVSVRAAGDDRQDPAVGKAERRAALGRVDEREPAGRAGADVDQPAAAARAARRSRRSRRRAAGAASRTAGATRASSSLTSSTSSMRREQVDVGVQRLALLGDGLGASHARGV